MRRSISSSKIDSIQTLDKNINLSTQIHVRVDSNCSSDKETDHQSELSNAHSNVVISGRRVAQHDELIDVIAKREITREHSNHVQKKGEVKRSGNDLTLMNVISLMID